MPVADDGIAMPHKPHKFGADGDLIERLEGDKRRKRVPIEDVLPRLGLAKSDSVVDLGPGTGYFTFPMSQLAGQVVGVDIEAKMLEVMKGRVADRGIENVSMIRGDMSHLPIADASVDHVFAAFVYHEVADQAELLAECARILKRGGRLTVIDFRKRIESDGPPIWVRKSPAHVRKTASRWFTPISSDGPAGYYQLMFSRN